MTSSTAGLARTSSRHPWSVVGGWIGLIVLSVALIFGLGLNLSTSFDFLNKPESVKGFDLVNEKFGLDNPPLETIVITSDNATVDDADFQQVVGEVMQTLRSSPDLGGDRSDVAFQLLRSKGSRQSRGGAARFGGSPHNLDSRHVQRIAR